MVDYRQNFLNQEKTREGGEVLKPAEVPKTPEEEIRELEQKLLEKKRELEKTRETEKPAEGPLKAAPSPAVPLPPLIAQKPPSKAAVETKLTEETKKAIDELIVTAFTKGLDKAVHQAQKLNSPYLLDAFHDTLVDKLYNELLAKRRIKEM